MERIKLALKPLIKRHKDEAIGLVACEPIAQFIACYLRRDPRSSSTTTCRPAVSRRITVGPDWGRNGDGGMRAPPRGWRSRRPSRPADFILYLNRLEPMRKHPKELPTMAGYSRRARIELLARALRCPRGSPKASGCAATAAARRSSASR